MKKLINNPFLHIIIILFIGIHLTIGYPSNIGGWHLETVWKMDPAGRNLMIVIDIVAIAYIALHYFSQGKRKFKR